jgi:triosephosphate isomerase (TIM)
MWNRGGRMREIRTSGLMSGEGKRVVKRYRALPRLYWPFALCLDAPGQFASTIHAAEKGDAFMPQLIAGNWKMHCLAADAVALAQGIAAGAQGIAAELLVCPAALHLTAVAQALKGSAVAVGGQDCHQAKQGPHTGDVAAPMLRDAGATWVILGHSERRRDHGETDEQVREKTLAAVEAGLTPIVCVGESADQRAGGQETEVVGWQLAGSLPKPFTGIVAYEPVWAIGTGKTATEEDVEIMHAFIRDELVRQFGDAGQIIRILYGGSVKAANAASLLAMPNVGGALVGGASLNAQEFLTIARAAQGG